MFFILSKILDFIFSPVNIIILLVLVSFFKTNFIKKNANKIRILSFVFLLLSSNPYIINKLLLKWELTGIKIKEVKKPYDAVIVLGGYMKYYNSELQSISFSDAYDRLGEACYLFHIKKVKYLILSGGNGSLLYQPAEALLAKKYLVSNMCIPDSCILIDTLSRNTYENLIESKKIIDKNNFENNLLITSAFHLRRSAAICKKLSMPISLYATDQYSGNNNLNFTNTLVPKSENFIRWEILMHEVMGYAIYKAKGYL